MLKKLILLVISVTIVLGGQENVYAAKNVVVLDPIYVTPMKYDEFESRTPTTVDVITREDIDQTNAQTTVDLFRSETGIMVKDWTGNGTTASVDIRGFGEQAGLNVAVLIDGRRINEMDISGVDWTQIPIDRIERIEIIRGGAGAVLYGNNASGGVINIITKRGEGDPHIEYTQRYGSYDMNEEKGVASGSIGDFSYVLAGGRKGTHGYRDNSYYDDVGFSSKLEYDVTSDLSLRFSQVWHEIEFGLPGALSSANLAMFDREYTAFPDDYVKQIDYNFIGGFDKDCGKWGKLSSDFSYRRREVYSFFIGAFGGWNPIQRSHIDTIGITPKYILDEKILGFENKFISGLDFYHAEYGVSSYNVTNDVQNDSGIVRNTLGVYAQDALTLFPGLVVSGGYRYEWAKYKFDYVDFSGWSPSVDDETERGIMAYNAGIVYQYIEGGEIFFNYNQSYLLPAADQYVSWGVLNVNLKPQRSKNYEVGIRHRIKKKLKVAVNGFLMNVEEELYYDGGFGGTASNSNYDKTRHQGLEAEVQLNITDNVSLYSNYTYTDARFRSGRYDGERIPMVPVNKGSAGARLSAGDFVVNIIGTYVGSRHFINDQANRFPELKRYFTLDANIFYENGNFTIGVGVNNILNQQFSEYGVCNATTGAVNYYPAPGANYFLEARAKF